MRQNQMRASPVFEKCGKNFRRNGGETPPYLRIRDMDEKLVHFCEYTEVRVKLPNIANQYAEICEKLVNNANTNATCVSF